MEVKIYELGGKKYHVPMICQAQEEILLGLLADVGLMELVTDFLLAKNENAELDIDRILKNLSEKRLLTQFMATLLVPVNEEFDESRIPEIAQLVAKADPFLKFDVAQDFFGIMGKYEEQFKRISPKFRETFQRAGKISAGGSSKKK